jgi:hypothetical protein
MRRREFIALISGAAALSSTRSRAQQPSKTYLISVLASAHIPYLIEVLKDGLRKFIQFHIVRRPPRQRLAERLETRQHSRQAFPHQVAVLRVPMIPPVA